MIEKLFLADPQDVEVNFLKKKSFRFLIFKLFLSVVIIILLNIIQL
jgi:hypothetical protein